MLDDGPVIVYYNYHSVPIPQERIEYLIKYVVSQLSLEFDRFFFCCDVRATSKDVVDKAESIEHCEVVHMSFSNNASMDHSICERMKWHAASMDGGHGLIALISDSGEFGPTLTALSRGGFKIAIFYPPNTEHTFLDYADESFALPIHRGGADENSTVSIVPGSPMRVQPADCNISTMAQDVRQGLTELLSRLSGAMGSPRALPDQEDVEDNKILPPNELIGSEDLHCLVPPALQDPNIFPRPLAPPFFGQPFAPIFPNAAPNPPNGFNPLPKDKLLCSRCRCETTPIINTSLPNNTTTIINNTPSLGFAEKNALEDKPNPFERKNPFAQTNPFQQTEKPNPFRKDNWKEEKDFGCFKNEDNDESWKVVPFRSGGGQRNPFASNNQTPRGKGDNNGGINNNNANNGISVQTDINPMANNSPNSEMREKFRKPAAQCPQWEDRTHRVTNNCPLWHPYKMCIFFPQCRSAAAECGYAHPFCCEGICSCEEGHLDPQLNHLTTAMRTTDLTI